MKRREFLKVFAAASLAAEFYLSRTAGLRLQSECVSKEVEEPPRLNQLSTDELQKLHDDDHSSRRRWRR
tara:strand:- start:401 stop:607 length:207 start_codon:yes stop_codon:yes gene_type:complete